MVNAPDEREMVHELQKTHGDDAYFEADNRGYNFEIYVIRKKSYIKSVAMCFEALCFLLLVH